ncbi:hypothetical protein WJX81_000950 [Elliptochloris bilobata]|uniref:Codanin-1 C-terminal domain-containing protein n=1 Tax=Elliptochloris bilobata TaxID=381761 RepID=A0AAW1QK28_9CHLO
MSSRSEAASRAAGARQRGSAAGRLALSLDTALLEALVAAPALALHAPGLRGALQQALALRSTAAQRGAGPGRSSMPGVFGVQAFTSDGQTSRTAEDQRRVSNRENVRDEFFALLRDAAAGAAPFGQRGAAAGLTLGAGGDDVAVYSCFAERAPALLRRLRADNVPAFARLFVATVMQAAVTGEALLDDELRRIARRNTARFGRLNLRLQAQPASGHGSVCRAHSPGASAGPATRDTTVSRGHGASAAFGAASSAAASIERTEGRGQVTSRAITGAAAEGIAVTLAVAAEFPPAQRLYVLFLEAADSHRLNRQLQRYMKAQLAALAEEGSCGGSGGGGGAAAERALAAAALAAFVSLLEFAGANGEAAGGPMGALDAAGALVAAAQGSTPGSGLGSERDQAALGGMPGLASGLLWTTPWVVRYLWFLGPGAAWGSEPARGGPETASGGPGAARTLAALAALQRSPVLRPGHPAFGPAALCLRCLLDMFMERMAAAGVALPQAKPDGGGATWETLVRVGETGDGDVDARLLQLCCPLLDHARRALQGALAGSGGESSAQARGGLRKITPSVPAGAAAAAAAAPGEAPAALAAAAAGPALDDAAAALRRAFLEAYSSPEAEVRLRDVVEWVADVLGRTAAAAGLACAMALAAERAESAVQSAAAAAAAAAAPLDGVKASERPGERAGAGEALRLQLGLAQAAAATEATLAALEAAGEAAAAHAASMAPRALAALAPPAWPRAVVGTAAALAAEQACAAAARRLLRQAPAVRTAACSAAARAATAAAKAAVQAGFAAL